ncbi:MAG: M48 family metallopeptidase, partial [Elusimicrobia bacterium]|jgi:predicted Zn-dependent protease|nr:M48 family metallopeptidase [Elusimicrobiota bacterium]
MKIRYCLLTLIFLIVGCTTVPMTGRHRLILSDEAQENAAGATSYGQYLSESKISKDKTNTALVKKVGKKIAAVSGCDYDWEFNLLENSEANAWCLSGGKVAVYTGILPYTKTEAGLATVMSHEIAHAIARHGAERSAQNTLLQYGLAIGGATLSNNPNRELILLGVNVAGNVGVILPYSRKHESEADYIGLLLMAKAGYDPNEAIKFWQRMASAASGSQGGLSDFLSTHPSDEKRIKDLREHLPEALQYYNKLK